MTKLLSTRSLMRVPVLDGADGRRREAATQRGLEHAQPAPKARPEVAVLRICRDTLRTTSLEPLGPPDCGQEGSAEGCVVWILGISRARGYAWHCKGMRKTRECGLDGPRHSGKT